jgi:hypothetical protein
MAGKKEPEPEGPKQVVLEDVRILYRNFSGLPGRFNVAGDRNFNVILDDEVAKAMESEGWNVRWQPPWEEGDPQRPILKVNVKYEGRGGKRTRPPRIVMITSHGKTSLDESMIALLDWAEIEHVDMIINPYPYSVQGRSGYSAYLKSIYVTIREDELELKYLDVPDSAQSAIVKDEGLEEFSGG